MTHSLQMTYIGHATVLIEIDGVRVLTDPLLRDRVSILHRRNAPIDPTSYQNIDAVLISHLHIDHLDLPSLRLLGHPTRLIVPRGTAAMLSKHGFRQVEEVQVGDTKTIGQLTVRATYAEHISTRYPFSAAADCLGYIIGARYTIYFAGDTNIFPEMTDLADDLDVALLPVWGWGPTIRKGHLSPRRAAQALALLRPRLAIPIHWGTMCPFGMGWMNPSFLTQPPWAFARYAAQLAPQVRIRVVPPGNSIPFEGGAPNVSP
jgi:L-ascorbate metabolism protein UlaG (beta-lactamase superfamily)